MRRFWIWWWRDVWEIEDGDPPVDKFFPVALTVVIAIGGTVVSAVLIGGAYELVDTFGLIGAGILLVIGAVIASARSAWKSVRDNEDRESVDTKGR